MIQLQNVTKTYRSIKAVDNISVEVNEGENMVLLGTSGCGKTTTLRMINRLTEASAGNIKVNGLDIWSQPAEKLRKGIGYVLQHNGLFPHYSVAENIGIVPSLLKWDKNRITQRTNELLEKLHLPHQRFAHLFPAQLSGGQQQRVGLARALAADPPILLMDEPFGALDPVTRNTIRKEFSNLEEFKKKTIVLVTHDVQEAFELGDRICLMDKGKIVQAGTPSDLLFKPANGFVRSFFNEYRFLLELQALNIRHIFPLILSANKIASGEIEPGTNLWQTLQILSGTQAHVSISMGDEKKVIDASALMLGFTKYKSAQGNE